MSFSESVIIPLSLFKACQLEKVEDEKTKIGKLLNDIDLPSSKKMQLYNQMKLTATKDSNQSNKSDELNESYKQDVLLNVAEKHRPNISSILDIIHDNPDALRIDNSTLEVSIRGRKIDGSNAIKIFQDLTKNNVVTKESDISTGALQVYNILVDELNVPKSWIPMKVIQVRRSSRKRKNTSDDIDQEGGWFIF